MVGARGRYMASKGRTAQLAGTPYQLGGIKEDWEAAAAKVVTKVVRKAKEDPEYAAKSELAEKVVEVTAETAHQLARQTIKSGTATQMNAMATVISAPYGGVGTGRRISRGGFPGKVTVMGEDGVEPQIGQVNALLDGSEYERWQTETTRRQEVIAAAAAAEADLSNLPEPRSFISFLVEGGRVIKTRDGWLPGDGSGPLYAPFSKHTPDFLWPWETVDGRRMTADRFARTPLPASFTADRTGFDIDHPVSSFRPIVEAVSGNRFRRLGDLPYYRFWGDAALGAPVIILVGGLLLFEVSSGFFITQRAASVGRHGLSAVWHFSKGLFNQASSGFGFFSSPKTMAGLSPDFDFT